jgi:hypothetical protein
MKLKRILSLVLILCLAFTFVSCKKDEESVIATPAHQYIKQLISDIPKLHEPWDLG